MKSEIYKCRCPHVDGERAPGPHYQACYDHPILPVGLQTPAPAKKTKFGRTPKVRLAPTSLEKYGVKYNPTISFETLEKFWILSAIQFANGNVTQAAFDLGIGRETVYRKLRQYEGKARK